MRQANNPQRRGDISFWFLIGMSVLLLTFFVFLATYFYFNRLPEDFCSGEGIENLNEQAEHSWPQYLGPTRDGVSPEKGLLQEWPKKGPPEKWRVTLGPGYSSMSIDKGRLVTMFREKGHEVVICLNADTGKPIWRRSYECSYEDQDGRYDQGPRATPTIDGDRVYTVSATNLFICWRLQDGKELWRKDLNREYDAKQLYWGVSYSPLIVGDKIITNPGGKKGSIVAFNKFTGNEIWKARDDQASYCSPIFVRAAGEDQIIIFNYKTLISVSAGDGRELWTLKWITKWELNIAVPLWIDDYLFVSSGYGKGCAKLKIVRDKDGNLDVETEFRNSDLCNQFTNSVYYNGHLYGFDRSDGPLVCMDYSDGKVKWEKEDLGRGQLLVVDGKIIVQTEGAEDDGSKVEAKLILLDPNPKEYTPISSFTYSRLAKCWAAPVVVNKKLYVRDNKVLICYDLEPK